MEGTGAEGDGRGTLWVIAHMSMTDIYYLAFIGLLFLGAFLYWIKDSEVLTRCPKGGFHRWKYTNKNDRNHIHCKKCGERRVAISGTAETSGHWQQEEIVFVKEG